MIIPTLYPESIRQQKNSRFVLVAEIADISSGNQVTQKSTTEFKTSKKNWKLHISSDYSLSFFLEIKPGLSCAVFFFCSSFHHVPHNELQVNLSTVYLFVSFTRWIARATIQTQANGFSNVRERSVNKKRQVFFFVSHSLLYFSIQIGKNDCNYNNSSTLLLCYSK